MDHEFSLCHHILSSFDSTSVRKIMSHLCSSTVFRIYWIPPWVWILHLWSFHRDYRFLRFSLPVQFLRLSLPFSFLLVGSFFLSNCLSFVVFLWSVFSTSIVSGFASGFSFGIFSFPLAFYQPICSIALLLAQGSDLLFAVSCKAMLLRVGCSKSRAFGREVVGFCLVLVLGARVG